MVDLKNAANEIAKAAGKLKAVSRPLLIAIDGRCAAGKTTLVGALRERLGCAVFHMDDFFLRPEQRTSERLETPGGNVDYERFLEEVLKPLTEGEKRVVYRPFDCKSMRLSAAEQAEIGDICVIEGSYSCHPELWGSYDLRVFLDVDKEEQIRRIVGRNGEEKAREFRDRWIPMEERYFAEYGVEGRCEMRFGLVW